MAPCLAQNAKKVRQDLSQARTYLKPRNKNYTQAEQLMTQLLKDSANQSDKRIFQVLFEAVKGQYAQANERLYLKQNQDTAAFFNLTRRMFTIAETLDTLDALPDKKGHITPVYRQRHAATLNTYRPNLFNAGTFFVRKGNWKDAYTFMDCYIDCASQPLFTGYNIAAADKRLPEAAYWATYSAYKQHDGNLTLKHHQLALRDTTHTDFTLQFIAEAHRWLDNRGSYVSTLEQGFRHNPTFAYFFPRLADAYMADGQYEKALLLADSALAVCDSCELFLFAKSTALLRLKRWEESIRYSRLTMARNDSLPEPYFNAGLAFSSLAEQLDPADEKVLRKDYLQKARTYLEYYRLLKPGEKDKWGPLLYRIYLHLNLGREFDEIDRLIRRN